MGVSDMRLVTKQLGSEMTKHKVFLALLFLLCCGCTAMFFYMHFAIDGNLANLRALPALTENQSLYQRALLANVTLARNFMVSMVGVTSGIFAMFFYRFFKKGKKQMGTLKALGIGDRRLRGCFACFTAALALLAVIPGVVIGYFTSDIFLQANMASYAVTGLVRRVSAPTALIGVLGPTLVFCLVALLCYGFIRHKEVGFLLAGGRESGKESILLRVAAKISDALPLRNKFPTRLALRKPVGLLILVFAVMGLLIFHIIGLSLVPSSQLVYASQMDGHHYRSVSRFDEYQSAPVDGTAALSASSSITGNSAALGFPVEVIGMAPGAFMLELKDPDGRPIEVPEAGFAVIHEGFQKMFGYGVGDHITLEMAGVTSDFIVSGIAANAVTNTILLNKSQLAGLLGAAPGAYNLVYGMDAEPGADSVVTHAEKEELLQRGMVSNSSSSRMNQIIGFLTGCFLIYLALLINFQDNTRDILILSMMGHSPGAIRKMLVDVYKPIMLVIFVLCVPPAILVANAIQMSLSVQTQDYMPFTLTPWTILSAFVLVFAIYMVVQLSFTLGVKRIIAREEISGYISSE